MGKGLGKLQKHILNHLVTTKRWLSKSEIYTIVIHEYWSDEIGMFFSHPNGCAYIYTPHERKELNKRRVCISQALGRLSDGGYVHIAPWGFTPTEKGVKAITP